MKLDKFGTVMFFIGSVSANFLTARSFDHGQDVDLGNLEDVNGFCSSIGHDVYGNASHWEDITIYETFEEQETQSLNLVAPVNTGLNRRADMCDDLTGITKVICDNFPTRSWFWGAGGVLGIYYSPRFMTNWFNVRPLVDCSAQFYWV